MKNIPLIKPKFPDPKLIAEDLEEIYSNNYYSNNGPIYRRFKKKLEDYVGQGLHCVVVSNATLGLMLAVKAVFHSDVTKKYVAVPSFTFAAAPLAAKWCGYEPVFFDVDRITSQPDIESFNSLLAEYKESLAGVILINNFGIGDSNVDTWQSILKEFDIPSITDSAPGFGSKYEDGRLLGAGSNCEVFSFHATKPFGIGEGGLVTTTDEDLAAEIEMLKNFGFDESKKTVGQGMNAKITELDCAIGVRVLEKYPETLADRRLSLETYRKILCQNKDIVFLPNVEKSAIQFASIIVKDLKMRQAILRNLADAGVEARTYYAPPVHESPLFKDSPRTNLGGTKFISDRIISLPLHPNMEEKDIQYISNIVLESITGA